MAAGITGHNTQRQALRRLLIENKLPQTILLSGISGIGKRLVAQEMAHSLLCESIFQKLRTGEQIDEDLFLHNGGCGHCNGCKTLSAGNAPDYYFVDCLDKDSWNTSAIRELLYSLHLKSFSAGNRVVLFNDAEEMSAQAANALLKSLEEPRPGLYFILVSSAPSRLPPTLLSRCQSWFFNQLTPDEIEKIIAEKNLIGELAEQIDEKDLAVLADGSLDSIERLAGNLENWKDLGQRLDAIASGKLERGLETAKEIAKDKKTLRDNIQLLRIHARKRMHESAEAKEQLKWSLCLSNLLSAEQYIFQRNLNASYVLQQVFTDLSRQEPVESLWAGQQLLEDMVV